VAVYSLIGSYATVQVITPTLNYDVVYCTIQTHPSGVIAAIAVQKETFDGGFAGPLLTDYGNNIELMMRQTGVIAGRGEQTLDESGLLTDNVAFTVQYVPPGSAGTSVTAEAIVPTGLLSEGGDPAIERVLLAEAEAIIAKVYANLKAAAGG
jgi:hypothetical protein